MRPAHLSPHHGQQVSGRSTSLPCVCVCVVSCLCDTSGSIAARTTRRQRPHIQTARIDRHLLDYKYEVLLREDGLRLCVSATADTIRPGDTTRTYETSWHCSASVFFLAASGINYSAQPALCNLGFSLFCPPQALSPPQKRRRLLDSLSSPLWAPSSSLGQFAAR